MNLIVDIGNSFIKLAIFSDGEMTFFKRYKKVNVYDLKQLKKKFDFEKVIISSVRKSHPYFVKHLIKKYKALVLSHKTKLPIVNKYGTPKTLGLDRIAVAVGAFIEYPKQNALIIDIGTCMTYDYIDKKGNYLGGNIAPGVELRLNAMHHFTSALPLVKRSWNAEILGKDTKSAIQNGAVWGVKLEIEAFIKTLTKKIGHLTVILTGGDATFFGEILDSKIFVDSYLLLKGLNEIIEYNH